MKDIMKYLENLTGTYQKQTKFNKLKCIVGSPIWYYLEKKCFNKFWKNIICHEILTNDDIVDFLDKNDFTYKPDKFYKMDLISSNPFFDRSTLQESKVFIQKEYTDVFIELFRKHIQFDIEEYVNLNIDTEVEIFKNELGENISAKVYTVTLRFCRQHYLQKAKMSFINWIIGILVLSAFGIVAWQLIQSMLLK